MIPLNGSSVFVMEDVPRMQLSADCPVTPGFRTEMNAWLASFFGMRNELADDEVLHVRNVGYYVNPRVYERLKKDIQPPTLPWERGFTW